MTTIEHEDKQAGALRECPKCKTYNYDVNSSTEVVGIDCACGICIFEQYIPGELPELAFDRLRARWNTRADDGLLDDMATALEDSNQLLWNCPGGIQGTIEHNAELLTRYKAGK